MPKQDKNPINDFTGDRILKDMAIKQGYVPATCSLPGPVVMGLMNKGEDPCSGCNDDRGVCKGRRKKGGNDAT